MSVFWLMHSLVRTGFRLLIRLSPPVFFFLLSSRLIKTFVRTCESNDEQSLFNEHQICVCKRVCDCVHIVMWPRSMLYIVQYMKMNGIGRWMLMIAFYILRFNKRRSLSLSVWHVIFGRELAFLCSLPVLWLFQMNANHAVKPTTFGRSSTACDNLNRIFSMQINILRFSFSFLLIRALGICSVEMWSDSLDFIKNQNQRKPNGDNDWIHLTI